MIASSRAKPSEFGIFSSVGFILVLTMSLNLSSRFAVLNLNARSVYSPILSVIDGIFSIADRTRT